MQLCFAYGKYLTVLGLKTRRFSLKSYTYRGYGTEIMCQRVHAFLEGWWWSLSSTRLVNSSVEQRSCRLLEALLYYLLLGAKKTVPFKVAGRRYIGERLSKEKNGLGSPHLGEWGNAHTVGEILARGKSIMWCLQDHPEIPSRLY